MNEVEVVGRKCEPSIQVVDLQRVSLASVLPDFHALDERVGYGNELRRRASSYTRGSGFRRWSYSRDVSERLRG